MLALGRTIEEARLVEVASRTTSPAEQQLDLEAASLDFGISESMLLVCHHLSRS